MKGSKISYAIKDMKMGYHGLTQYNARQRAPRCLPRCQSHPDVE